MKYALVFQPDHSFDVILADKTIIGYDHIYSKGGLITKVLNHKIESYPSHQEAWDALAFHNDREKIEVPYQSSQEVDAVLKILNLKKENEVPLTSIFNS